MRKLLLIMAAVAALCLPLSACDGKDAALRASQALDISYATYDAAMQVCAAAYQAGRLSPENREKVIALGQTYVDAYRLGMQSLLTYVQTHDEAVRGDVVRQLAVVQDNLNALLRQALALGLDVKNLLAWEKTLPAGA